MTELIFSIAICLVLEFTLNDFLSLSFSSLPLQTCSVLAGGPPVLPGECACCVFVLLCFVSSTFCVCLRVRFRVGVHLYFRVGVCMGVGLYVFELAGSV